MTVLPLCEGIRMAVCRNQSCHSFLPFWEKTFLTATPRFRSGYCKNELVREEVRIAGREAVYFDSQHVTRLRAQLGCLPYSVASVFPPLAAARLELWGWGGSETHSRRTDLQSTRRGVFSFALLDIFPVRRDINLVVGGAYPKRCRVHSVVGQTVSYFESERLPVLT